MDIDHALIIGGTGMLCRATVAIAKRSRQLTAVARTHASLNILASLLSDRTSDSYHSADWDQPEQFVSRLQRLTHEIGYPTFVLAWLHDINLGPRIAMAVSRPDRPCDFFQVLGSSGCSPQGPATDMRSQVGAAANLRYFQVVLGFMHDAGATRWLTNDEISDGVLEAIRKRKTQHVVGTVEPWDQRPQ